MLCNKILKKPQISKSIKNPQTNNGLISNILLAIDKAHTVP